MGTCAAEADLVHVLLVVVVLKGGVGGASQLRLGLLQAGLERIVAGLEPLELLVGSVTGCRARR